MYQRDEHPEQCPSCASVESTVPIVTINGRTLWDCTDDSCSGGRWYSATTHEGVRENPDPETIEKLLNGAAEHRDEAALQGIADDITRLYRTTERPTTGRTPNASRDTVDTTPSS
jgi:hypothetical protein